MADSVVAVRNSGKGTCLGNRVRVARSLVSRGRGLMLRRSLDPDDGLLIDPFLSIHTMWMRFAIDVLYVDREGTVVRADAAMKPWRVGPIFTGARYVIELPPGTIGATGTQAGDRLWIESHSGG
jgi:uncharacterized protein